MAGPSEASPRPSPSVGPSRRPLGTLPTLSAVKKEPLEGGSPSSLGGGLPSSSSSSSSPYPTSSASPAPRPKMKFIPNLPTRRIKGESGGLPGSSTPTPPPAMRSSPLARGRGRGTNMSSGGSSLQNSRTAGRAGQQPTMVSSSSKSGSGGRVQHDSTRVKEEEDKVLARSSGREKGGLSDVEISDDDEDEEEGLGEGAMQYVFEDAAEEGQERKAWLKAIDMDLSVQTEGGGQSHPMSLPRQRRLQKEEAPKAPEAKRVGAAGAAQDGLDLIDQVKSEPMELELQSQVLHQDPSADLERHRIDTVLEATDEANPPARMAAASSSERIHPSPAAPEPMEGETMFRHDIVSPHVDAQHVYIWQMPSYLPRMSLRHTKGSAEDGLWKNNDKNHDDKRKQRSVHFTPTTSECGSREPSMARPESEPMATESTAPIASHLEDMKPAIKKSQDPDNLRSALSYFTLQDDPEDPIVQERLERERVKPEIKSNIEPLTDRDYESSAAVGDETDLKSWEWLYRNRKVKGQIGTLKVHRSGRMRTFIGDVPMDLIGGSDVRFAQDVVQISLDGGAAGPLSGQHFKRENGESVETKQGGPKRPDKCVVIGNVQSRLILLPDVEALLHSGHEEHGDGVASSPVE